MHWQSPTFNVQCSRTIAFACMFNKGQKEKKKHQHLMPKKKKNQTRALQACFSKSELEKELATFIMCVLNIMLFMCFDAGNQTHEYVFDVWKIWMQSKYNDHQYHYYYGWETFGHFIFCLICSRFAHKYVCETRICIKVNW